MIESQHKDSPPRQKWASLTDVNLVLAVGTKRNKAGDEPSLEITCEKKQGFLNQWHQLKKDTSGAC